MDREKSPMNRREFLLAGGLVGLGTAAAVSVIVKDRLPAPPIDVTGEATVRKLSVLKNVAETEGEDTHVRMQRELVRAMSKPVEQRHWIMIIDTRKCVGCQACTIGCIAENKLPPGVVYRPVVTEESGVYPNVQLHFLPRPCMHCDNPSCTPVCPVKATWKRPDGIVVVDYERCIGCRYCLNGVSLRRSDKPTSAGFTPAARPKARQLRATEQCMGQSGHGKRSPATST